MVSHQQKWDEEIRSQPEIPILAYLYFYLLTTESKNLYEDITIKSKLQYSFKYAFNMFQFS